jgi:hypothetical protein
MKKVAGVILLFVSISSWAQRDIDANSGWALKDRIYTSGGFNLGGGTGYFNIGFSPSLGYMITPNFSSGLNLVWNHIRYTDVDRKINQYAGGPFIRYNFDKLFAYSEFGHYNTNTIFSDERITTNRLLLGLGYMEPIVGKASINLMALYDVIYDRMRSPFASPWVFRVFFTL